MDKVLVFAALIFWSSGSVAQQPLIEPCAGMEGYAAVLCHKNIQEQQQQELAQSLSVEKQRRIQDQKMQRLGFREQPGLLGRMFFDNVAAKVGEKFLIGK
jgi:hypothetical protein